MRTLAVCLAASFALWLSTDAAACINGMQEARRKAPAKKAEAPQPAPQREIREREPVPLVRAEKSERKRAARPSGPSNVQLAGGVFSLLLLGAGVALGAVTEGRRAPARRRRRQR